MTASGDGVAGYDSGVGMRVTLEKKTSRLRQGMARAIEGHTGAPPLLSNPQEGPMQTRRQDSDVPRHPVVPLCAAVAWPPRRQAHLRVWPDLPTPASW
jgi:hypothetical protein